MKRKLRKVYIGSALIAGLVQSIPGFAQEVAREKSIFEACQDVHIVAQGKRDKALNSAVSAGCSNIQESLNVGYTVTRIQDGDIPQALLVLNNACETVKSNYVSNLEILKQMQALTNPTNTSEEAVKFRAGVKAEIEQIVPVLRQELAVANLLNPVNITAIRPQFTALGTGNYPGIPNPAGTFDGVTNSLQNREGLTAEELSAARKTASEIRAKAMAAADAEIKSKGASVGAEEIRRTYQQKAHEAQLEKFKATFFGQAKFLAYLSPLDAQWENGKPSWSDEKIHAAFGALIANTEEMIAKTQRAMDRKTIEFSRWDLERVRKAKIGGEMDMMDCMEFKPAVEDVLKKFPELCGAATGLAQHTSYKDAQNVAAITGVGVGVGLALGGAGAAAGGALGGGAAGAAMGATIGGTVGAYGATAAMAASDLANWSRAEKAVLTSSGLDSREKSVMDYKKIAEAEASFNDLVGMTALMTGPGGKAVQLGIEKVGIPLAKLAASSLNKGLLKLEGLSAEEIAKLTRLAKSADPETAEQAKALLRGSLARNFKSKVFRSDNPTQQEIRLANQMAEKGFAGTADSPRPERIQKIADSIRFLTTQEAERAQLMNKVTETLQRIPAAAAAGVTTSDDALSMIVNGADAGVSSSHLAQIAGNSKQPMSIYSELMGRMAETQKKPKFAAIKDPAARAQAALSHELEELRKARPDFSKMDEGSWQSFKAQVIRCMTGRS